VAPTEIAPEGRHFRLAPLLLNLQPEPNQQPAVPPQGKAGATPRSIVSLLARPRSGSGVIFIHEHATMWRFSSKVLEIRI
jgi:hypothetical protein